MSFEPRDVLRHILDEADYLVAASRELSENTFYSDPTRQRAFVRSLEVIGEAAKLIPSDFRAAHPHIDWRGMAGMRDRLIHAYFGVDYELIWDVVVNRVPQLRADISKLIAG
jgi:uncharacterized protein with HEPN domain